MAEITLEQLLQSRENRVGFQRELLAGYGLPLVSFTVNMPGPVKKDARSELIFSAGVRALREKLAGRVVYFKRREPDTGYEGYFVVEAEAAELKRLTAQIEQNHALGRLFDMDVLAPGGEQVGRESVGFKRRECLVCGADAAVCARSRAHTLDALYAEIDLIIGNYRKAEEAGLFD